MKAKFINMFASSIGPNLEDLENYVPEDPEIFRFGVQVTVGAEGEEGVDSFDIKVVSPKWILFNGTEKIFMGRHYLIMLNYDFDRLKNFIVSYIESCTGNTWKEVADKVGRLGKSEYEDYEPFDPSGP